MSSAEATTFERHVLLAGWKMVDSIGTIYTVECSCFR